MAVIFFVGSLLVAYMMVGWFGAVIKESRAGLYSPQLDRSFRWGMTWVYFSEVMFLPPSLARCFYVRNFSGPGWAAKAARRWRICCGPISSSPGRCCTAPIRSSTRAQRHHPPVGLAAAQYGAAGQFQRDPDHSLITR